MLAALKWIGTVLGIAGAFTVAAHLPVSGWGYVLFLGGSIAWTIAGAIMREPAIWLLNAVFSTANLVGIWRWLLV